MGGLLVHKHFTHFFDTLLVLDRLCELYEMFRSQSRPQQICFRMAQRLLEQLGRQQPHTPLPIIAILQQVGHQLFTESVAVQQIIGHLFF